MSHVSTHTKYKTSQSLYRPAGHTVIMDLRRPALPLAGLFAACFLTAYALCVLESRQSIQREDLFGLTFLAALCCPAFALMGALLGDAVGRLRGSPVECQLLIL